MKKGCKSSECDLQTRDCITNLIVLIDTNIVIFYYPLIYIQKFYTQVYKSKVRKLESFKQSKRLNSLSTILIRMLVACYVNSHFEGL